MTFAQLNFALSGPILSNAISPDITNEEERTTATRENKIFSKKNYKTNFQLALFLLFWVEIRPLVLKKSIMAFYRASDKEFNQLALGLPLGRRPLNISNRLFFIKVEIIVYIHLLN